MLAIFLLACFVATQAATAGPVPLVMWHGMGESVTPTVAPYVVITQATWSDSRLTSPCFVFLSAMKNLLQLLSSPPVGVCDQSDSIVCIMLECSTC